VNKNLNFFKFKIFVFLFKVNRGSDTFEHTLLTYLYNQINLNHSSNYGLNQTIIGFIDSIEINHMNQSNLFLYRLNRENLRFDPSIFVVISIIIISMLIGNEWHRRIFLKKIQNHYYSYSSKMNKFQIGIIIGLLLFSCFMILYYLDRYLTFIIEEIYLLSFILFSSLVIYLCFERFYYEFYQRFKTNKNIELLNQWFRLILKFISFIMIILWFLNRFTYIGLILTNFIVFCMTIVIIVQMRVVNLMISMIIFSFIVLFESLTLIVKGNVVLCEF